MTLGPIQSAVEIKDKLFHLVKRIHGCYSPVGNADSQEEEGDDRVEKGRHDVSNGPESKSVGEGERERERQREGERERGRKIERGIRRKRERQRETGRERKEKK